MNKPSLWAKRQTTINLMGQGVEGILCGCPDALHALTLEKLVLAL